MIGATLLTTRFAGQADGTQSYTAFGQPLESPADIGSRYAFAGG